MKLIVKFFAYFLFPFFAAIHVDYGFQRLYLPLASGKVIEMIVKLVVKATLHIFRLKTFWPISLPHKQTS